MSFLLDTNICSAHLKTPSGLIHRFVQHGGALAIPTIVLGELYTWAYRRKNPRELISIIDTDLLANLRIINYDQSCASQFGQLTANLLDAGNTTNPVDVMIAAVALTHDLTLVTHNVRHFAMIPRLRIVDWLE